MKPMIISVEGADKAGKHTQVVKMVEYLNSRGIVAETLDFPQYNSYWGQFIKKYLNGDFGPTRELPAEYTMLPYTLDRQAHTPLLQQWINEGKWVVLDRYTYSNVYFIAKLPREQWNEKIAYLEDMEFNQMGIIKPDYNIYLDLPAQISYNMRTHGLKAHQNGQPDIHEKDLQLLTDVADVYKTIAKNNPQNWTIVNEIKQNGTRMTPDEIFALLQIIIEKLIRCNSRY